MGTAPSILSRSRTVTQYQDEDNSDPEVQNGFRFDFALIIKIPLCEILRTFK